MDRLTHAREAEVKYSREQNDIDISKTRELAEIETEKFKNMVDAIGTTTLQAMATAGPDLQVRRRRRTSNSFGIDKLHVFQS